MSTLRCVGALAFGSALAACTPKGTTAPDDFVDPITYQLDGGATFKAALLKLSHAESDGVLTAAECTSVSEAFRDADRVGGAPAINALFNIAVVWERCGDLDRAQAVYREVIARQPAHAAALNNLGALAWRANDRAAAGRLFQGAVKADTNDPSPRNNLASVLRERYVEGGKLEDFETAESALQAALAVDSDNIVAYENLARLYYDRGQHDRSYLLLADLVITQASRIVKRLQQPSAELHNLRGLLFMANGDAVAALKSFKAATSVQPSHTEAHLNIAMIALRFRDYTTAEASLEQALKDDQRDYEVSALLGLGVAQRGLRNYESAEQTLTRAQKLAPRDARVLYNLGILHQEHIAPLNQERRIAADSAAEFDDTDYRDAMRYFGEFTRLAAGKHAQQVADARMRVASIKQFLVDVDEMEQLLLKQKAQEAADARDAEVERKRLLKLEQEAREALAKDRADAKK